MPHDSADAVFTFALRAGDLMIRNGAPSSNVTQVLLAVTSARGFPGASANVTMGQISLGLLRPGEPPITLVHSVGATTFNLEAVTETEQLVKDVITGDVGIADGLRRLDELDPGVQGHTPLVQLLGWGVMGAGFAWLIGGGLAACVLAGVTAVLIELVGGRLARAELPGFFGHVLAGATAVLAAVVGESIASTESAALVITAALVSRLAGAATFGAAHDILTGWYLTAAGRLVEVALNTSGQVVGVVLMASAVGRLGIHLAITEQAVLESSLWVATAAAVMISCGFAGASQLRWRRMPAVAVLTAFVYLVYVGVQAADWNRLVAAAVAATLLGGVTVLIAPHIKIPSSGALGIVLAPLLPGMLVYEGFVEMALDRDGGDFFLQAAGVALSTGAGAVLGQYLAAQLVGRTRRRLEQGLLLEGGDEIATNPHALTARWLSAPTFRRPYLVDTIGALHRSADDDERRRAEADGIDLPAPPPG